MVVVVLVIYHMCIVTLGTRTRTVTRGVNRGAREELMYAMEQQIKRCEEPIEPLLREFFKQEKLSLGKYSVT